METQSRDNLIVVGRSLQVAKFAWQKNTRHWVALYTACLYVFVDSIEWLLCGFSNACPLGGSYPKSLSGNSKW